MVVRLPPLHALRTFEAVARLGSVTAAADDLCITHSAVSHQLNKLEEWMEMKLFERQGRGIRLTEAGDRYRLVICEAFARMAAETSLIRRSKSEEEVKISSLPMFAVSWFLPQLHDFWGTHPDIGVTLHYSRGTQEIDPDSTDLAVRYGAPEDFPGFSALRLLDGDAIPVCSPAYLREHPIRSVSDIPNCALIHDDDRRFWRKWLEKAGLDPAASETGEVMPDGNLSLASVMAGDGIGLLRRTMIERHLRSHSLIRLSEITIEEDLHYLLLVPQSRPLRRNVLIFKEWLMARVSLTGSPGQMG